MLPHSKEGFPKAVYLDQNKWISIAREENGMGDGSLSNVLDAINRALASNAIVLPLSDIYILETLAPSDEYRRLRIAKAMLKFSRRLAIRPAKSLQKAEISYYVAKALGYPLNYSVRENAVALGIANALGSDLEFHGNIQDVQEAQQYIQSDEYVLGMLASNRSRSNTERLRETEEMEAAEIDAKEGSI